MTNHNEFDLLLHGYALHALGRDEERAFEEHLAGCDACQRDLAALREVTAALARAAPSVRPPAG
ncbi:MAG: anti-sigma factor, partial [SAR202 cluster bacterium]|nr:anti-sigma factor [SAR202 cluster bacterium]